MEEAGIFKQRFLKKFEQAVDFEEEFGRLPMPITSEDINQMTLQIDKQMGYVRNPNYNPADSFTYKLLTKIATNDDVAGFIKESKKEIEQLNAGVEKIEEVELEEEKET